MLPRATLLALLFLWGCRDPSAGPPGHVPLTSAQKARLAELTRAPSSRAYPLHASLGGGRIALLGVEVVPALVRPGEPVLVTWYWRCVKPLDEDVRVFVHLEDGQGRHLGNADHLLSEGLVATSTCEPGTTYADPHSFTLSPGPSLVRLMVGLYRLDRRVPVDPPGAPGDRIEGPTLQVLAPPPAPSIVIPRANGAAVIDGDLSDPAWWGDAATFPLVRSLDGGPPALATTVHLAWWGADLLVAFDVKDPDVWATLTARDAPIYEEEAVELFAGPAEGPGYKEIELSPADVLFDASFEGPRQGMDVSWDSQARHAVHLRGTLARGDRDQGFTAELAIPLERLGVRPEPGARLVLNAYRLERPAAGPMEGSALSPPLRGDFHAPDRFAHAVLGP